MLVLLGVSKNDTEADADYLADKIIGLRVFEDARRQDEPCSGGMLTEACWWSPSSRSTAMCGRASGHPSMPPLRRKRRARLYEYFVERIRAAGLRCETGRFQEMMQVELVNDGPVTILLDSSKAF